MIDYVDKKSPNFLKEIIRIYNLWKIL
jgi:hypothetical protein